jgi:hypothetical protein
MPGLARRLAPVIFLSALAVVASGCHPGIELSSARYQPSFSAPDLSAYRGTAVIMRNFENVDDSTSFFAYRGDVESKYGGPVLTSYFWYCLRAAFEQIGVTVYTEDNAPAGAHAPIMEARLVRINERAYQVGVGLIGGAGNVPLRKTFAAPGPPIVSNDRRWLEARAYHMMDVLFLTIVRDPEFQAAFLAANKMPH